MKSTAVTSSTVTSYTQYNDLRQDASFSSFLSITANTPADWNVNINDWIYTNSLWVKTTVTWSSITGINFPTWAWNKWYVLLSLNNSWTVVKTYWSASLTPTKPATPTDNLPLAYLLLSQWGTTIAQTDIIDARSIWHTAIDSLSKADIWNDFYKYQIIPTVASNNLTVTLKNYAWNDPSPTAPVKVQIWDTVRTIASALSVTMNAWTNWLNLWSSELATKEVDLFTYLIWNTNLNAVQLWVARCGHFRKWSDTNGWNTTNEKDVYLEVSFPASSNVMQNIGRFSAILSVWVWYTWSLWTWPTINHYINETRWLDWIPTLSASWSMTWTWGTIYFAKYKIVWTNVYIKMQVSWTTWGVASTELRTSTPIITIWNSVWYSYELNEAWVYSLETAAVLTAGYIRFQKSNIANFWLWTDRFCSTVLFYEI